MAEYDFEYCACRKGVFTLVMRISQHATAKIGCPGCGSAGVEPLMPPFVAKTAKKS